MREYLILFVEGICNQLQENFIRTGSPDLFQDPQIYFHGLPSTKILWSK